MLDSYEVSLVRRSELELQSSKPETIYIELPQSNIIDASLVDKCIAAVKGFFNKVRLTGLLEQDAAG